MLPQFGEYNIIFKTTGYCSIIILYGMNLTHLQLGNFFRETGSWFDEQIQEKMTLGALWTTLSQIFTQISNIFKILRYCSGNDIQMWRRACHSQMQWMYNGWIITEYETIWASVFII
jgi:uncharacterized protein (DUF2461 family)